MQANRGKACPKSAPRGCAVSLPAIGGRETGISARPVRVAIAKIGGNGTDSNYQDHERVQVRLASFQQALEAVVGG